MSLRYPDRLYPLSLTILLSIALGLRLYGVDHGAPACVGGDERLVCTDAVGFLARGTLSPGHYNYPALYSYLFSAGLYLHYLAGGIWDLGSAGDSTGFAWFFAPYAVFLTGRLVSVLAGVGLVAATYLLGVRAWGRAVGLAGAAAVALSPLLVSHAKSALPETAMAFFTVLSCCYLIDIAKNGRSSAYALAGLFAGLAISTKYNAGMVLGGLAAAHILRLRVTGNWRDRNPLLAGAALLAGFFLGSPYWLVYPGKYYAALLDVSSNLQFSLEPVSWPHLRLLVSFWSAEQAWGLLGTSGCLYALWRRAPSDWILLAIVIPAFLYVGSWPKSSLHYVIYLLPLASLLGARALIALIPRPSWLTPTVLLLLLLPNAYQSLRAGYRQSREDVRAIAARWIENHIPGNSVIGGYSSDYHPPLKRVDVEYRILQGLIDKKSETPGISDSLRAVAARIPFYRWVDLEYYRPESPVPPEYQDRIDFDDPKTRRIFGRAYMSYEEMKQKGVQYIVLPEAAYRRFLDSDPPPAGTPAHYHFTRNRDYVLHFFQSPDRYRLLRKFAPPDGSAGATITLFQVH